MSNHVKPSDTPETGYNARRTIDGKTFHVLFEEVEIEATVDEVWSEVSGNFVNGAEIAASLNASYCLTGGLTEGLGTERYLDINFQGKRIEAKERIIDFREDGKVRELTYEVYETKGAPIGLKTYNTWYVRRGSDDRTHLGNVFIFKAKLFFLTGLVGKMLAKSGSIRTGLLTYKHYLETGEKKVSQEELLALYGPH
jgi:hypothetical protein